MKTVTNLKLINKIKVIMRVMILITFACFGIAIYLIFTNTVQSSPLSFITSTVLLIAAYTLFRVYVLLTGRYGASPRLEERLSLSLKGLSEGYTLYNYVFETSHVLIGKSRIWLFELYEVSGKITYTKHVDKWTYKKPNRSIINFLSPDTFRDPKRDFQFMEKDWRVSIEKIQKQTGQDFSRLDPPEKILVFMHSDVEIKDDGSGLIMLKSDQLKDFIRKSTCSNKDQQELIQTLVSVTPRNF